MQDADRLQREGGITVDGGEDVAAGHACALRATRLGLRYRYQGAESWYARRVSGRPDPLLEAACELAAAVDRAAARIQYVNTVIGRAFKRSDIVLKRRDPDYGKPRFNAAALREDMAEEVQLARQANQTLEKCFATLGQRGLVMKMLVEAAEWRCRASAFTPTRQQRRVTPIRMNASTGQTLVGTEAWLHKVHGALVALRLLPNHTTPQSFARQWRRWRKRRGAPAHVEGRIAFLDPRRAPR